MNAIATLEPTITRVSRTGVNVAGYVAGWPRARADESWEILVSIGFYPESLEVKNFILLIDFTQKPMFHRVWVLGRCAATLLSPRYVSPRYVGPSNHRERRQSDQCKPRASQPLQHRRVGGLGAYTSDGVRALSATTGVMERTLG